MVQEQFQQFIELVDRHIRELEGAGFDFQSNAWFFSRYLRRLLTLSRNVASPRDLENSMRGLVRFYVDSIEGDPALQSRFEEILESHRRALRAVHKT
jgi:hypothetical protein